MTSTSRKHNLTAVVAFGLVYILWGSTYLAIRIAVEHIPPALLCGVRFLISGFLMLGYCWLCGRAIWLGARQLLRMSIVGVLLLMGGNLTLSYAETIVPSGLAALIISSTPIWFLVLDVWLLGDHHFSLRGVSGLVLGIVGIGILVWPKLRATGGLERRQLWACVVLVSGSMSWALGSVLARIWKSAKVDPLSATGWQMVAAGIANSVAALALGDWALVQWTPRGVGAIAYLVVCGSLIGYTAYIWLVNNVPTSKASTYAYVNPVIAVLLGWWILREAVDVHILAGSVIIVASVVLVTSAKVKKTVTVADELPAVEAAGD